MVGQGAMFHSLILNYEIIPEKELTPIKTLLLDMLDT
jgi:hypothetical protein